MNEYYYVTVQILYNKIDEFAILCNDSFSNGFVSEPFLALRILSNESFHHDGILGVCHRHRDI